MNIEEKNKRLKRNIWMVYLLDATWMLMLILPIIVPFFQKIGLSMEQVFQVQAIFSFYVLILELPSGYLSDLLGRKKTLLLATFFHAFGFSLFPFVDSFMGVVVVELFLALGLSLFSGTDVALLYDTMEDLGEKGGQARLVGNRMFYAQSGETIASLIGGAIALISLSAVVIANAVAAWIPFLICFFLYEPERKLMSKKGHKENWKYIFKSLFGHSSLLTLIIFNTVFYGVATLVAVWTYQNHWKLLGIPIAWFGVLWASTNMTTAIMGKYAHVVEKNLGSTLALTLMALLPIAGYLGLGFVEGLWSITFIYCFQICRGLGQVLLKDALNTRVTGDMRATANSVSSLGVRLVFCTIGPLMGWMTDVYSQPVAFRNFGYGYIFIFIVLMVPLLGQRKKFVTN